MFAFFHTHTSFENPYPDHLPGAPVVIDTVKIKNVINLYVHRIIGNRPLNGVSLIQGGGIYAGPSGAAYMCFHILGSKQLESLHPMVFYYAKKIIKKSLINERVTLINANASCEFLCGYAGVVAVAATIMAYNLSDRTANDYLRVFGMGFSRFPTKDKEMTINDSLVDRIIYLSGILWLNRIFDPKPYSEQKIMRLCLFIYDECRHYAIECGSPTPLMYDFCGSDSLRFTYGLIGSIILIFLQSPLFRRSSTDPTQFPNISAIRIERIRATIDGILDLQHEDGRMLLTFFALHYPENREDLNHFCITTCTNNIVYMFAKAYLLFKDLRYLRACERLADAIWNGGLSRNPGICHGLGASGYIFLLVYRLTDNDKYLYRANKFADFLNHKLHRLYGFKSTYENSLFEGLAGTTCFLTDLLDPKNATFPFIDVFHEN